MRKRKFLVPQGTLVYVTENGNDVVVTCRSVGARVVRRNMDGSPWLCRGGDVRMHYTSGLTRRVPYTEFLRLMPRDAIVVHPRDMY